MAILAILNYLLETEILQVFLQIAILVKYKSTTEPFQNKKYYKISMLQDLDMEYKKYFITKMQNNKIVPQNLRY